MSAPWTAHHPPGVRPDLPSPAHRSLGALARASARRFGDAPAVTTVLPNGFEGTLSFAELDRQADAFAAWLLTEAGVVPGDRVAVILPNCNAYPVAVLGIFRAGAVAVNTNPLYTARELSLQLVDSGATVAVVLDRLADRLAEALEPTRVRTVVAASVAEGFTPGKRLLVGAKLALAGPRQKARYLPFREALRRGFRARVELPDPGPDDVALFQYTGGTTGTSKAAVLTHGNVLWNLAQVEEITRPCLDEAAEVELSVLPLYHVFGFTLGFLYPLSRGFRNVLVPLPRPLRNVAPAFRKHPISFAPAVQTLLAGLLGEQWFLDLPRGRLKAVYAGGAAVDDATRENFEQASGALVIEGYGLSEASPLVTYNPAVKEGDRLVRTLDRVGGVGLPLPSTEVRIVDDHGHDLPAGEKGEVVVRGPQVLQGYHGRPDETAATLRDGWLHTGDVGILDEKGYLRLVDRKKDMISVSGFKVYPAEVEACIALHPGVAEVAVVGVPDPATGEAVRAFVVPRAPALTADEVRAHCKGLLTGYKIPRSVAFLEEMPKNQLGKVLRRELRDAR